MFQVVAHDDNPRLHRTSFLLLWICSYGFGWGAIRLYERLWNSHFLIGFSRWLKNDDLYSSAPWREDLFLGILFGLILAAMQGWLLKQRYGYVPRLFRIATFLGAVLAGFGYVRVCLGYYASPDTYVLRVIQWFSLMAVCQTFVLIRVNRQAWRIVLVGIVASVVACTILLLKQTSIEYALVAGIIIQSIATGFVMLRVMDKINEGTVTKRKNNPKSKSPLQANFFHPITFISLWLGFQLFSILLMQFAWWIYWLMIIHVPIMADFHSWLMPEYFRIIGISIFLAATLILPISQKWMLEKQTQQRFRHWVVLSMIGWFIAAICFENFYTGSPLLPSEFRFIWFGIAVFMPSWFQSLVIVRHVRAGWFWVATGLFTAIVTMSLDLHFRHLLYYRHIMILGFLVLSLTTSITFLGLHRLTGRAHIQHEVGV